jgi:hypothetical protein
LEGSPRLNPDILIHRLTFTYIQPV